MAVRCSEPIKGCVEAWCCATRISSCWLPPLPPLRCGAAVVVACLLAAAWSWLRVSEVRGERTTV